MQIDDPVRKCIDKRTFNDPHETGEHNQIGLKTRNHLNIILLRLAGQFRAEGSRIEKAGFDSKLSSEIEDFCVRLVADDRDDLRLSQPACFFCTENRRSIAAPPRSKYYDPHRFSSDF